jgi:Cellulose binding domain
MLVQPRTARVQTHRPADIAAVTGPLSSDFVRLNTVPGPQSGQAVTVTSASWNATIAASGGTVSIGFNGTDTGQDPAPTVFYIDDNVCAND